MKLRADARAAQYIRMSTDSQELSPAVQKQELQRYAEARGFQIVATYEDGGRSGLTIKERPALRRLITDVTSPDRPFEHVLVYDVTRWGRFQDTDASAYYEYHCRLHGVRLVYVMEPFENDTSPMTALFKNMKRMMAAEYSRELMIKTRAGQELAMRRGFQMGSPPCIGFRRVTVRSDGTVGRELVAGERKPMLTDRVRWVLGPPDEVALVRYIFDLYTESNITIKGVVARLGAEGRRDSSGRTLTHQILRGLLRCEAFVGTFVWGRREDRTGLIRHEGDDGYTQIRDVIPPIITREQWERAQHKRRLGQCPRRTKEEAIEALRAALAQNPLLALADLPGSGCPTEIVYRRYFGSFRTALRLAGRDDSMQRELWAEKCARAQRVAFEFRRDLDRLMETNSLPLRRNPRSNVLVHVNGARVAVQIIWRRQGRHGFLWWLKKSLRDYSHVLLVRMERNETANDFILLATKQYVDHPPWFEVPVDGALRLRSARELVEAFGELQNGPPYTKPKEGYRRLRYVTPLPSEALQPTRASGSASVSAVAATGGKSLVGNPVES